MGIEFEKAIKRYYVDYEGDIEEVEADDLVEDGNAQTLWLKGELVRHYEKKRVSKLSLVAEEEPTTFVIETRGEFYE